MAKALGSSGAGGSGGVGGRSASASGLIGRVQDGIKDSQLEYLRTGMRPLDSHREAFEGRNANDVATGAVDTNQGRKFAPIRIEIEKFSGRVRFHLRDGRHRLAAAREYGATKIRAEITVRGPRGGIAEQRTVIIAIPEK